MEKQNYRYYSNEELEISSIDSKLSKEEKKVRRYLMNYVIDNGHAFNMKNSSKIADDIGQMDKDEVDSILKTLMDKNGIVADDEGNINYIYPVSAVPTSHKIRLKDGREFTAMCAIDGIGTAFTFKQDVDIESSCSHCGSNVSVKVRDGKIYDYEPKDLHILHVDLNKNMDWSGNC